MRLGFVLAILLAPALAGCFGASEDAAPLGNASTNDTPRDSSFQLPDDRGTSSAATETNKTEEGVGGVDHKHDYWKGADQITLFDATIRSSLYPFFPNGEGTTPAGVFYIQFAEGQLVYEGAEKVVVTLSKGDSQLPDSDISIQYLTAASSEWTTPQPITFGNPVEISVSARETDMPHSTHSLWNFRFVIERPPTIFFDRVHATIVAQRGGNIVDWPGHPDFYNERDSRLVYEGGATTHQYGFPENTFYEGQDDWVRPDKLVSYGTGHLDVYVNITKFSSVNPALQSSGYILYVHNATDLGIVCCNQSSHEDEHGQNDLTTYWFRVPVHPTGMDGPYQPASRWGFRVTAVIGANVPTVGPVGFTDGASYDIDYQIKIVAHKGGDAAMGNMTMT